MFEVQLCWNEAVALYKSYSFVIQPALLLTLFVPK